MTVKQILYATIKRRGLRYGEYVLEKRGEPGVKLEPGQTLCELEERAQGPIEFVLIKKHSAWLWAGRDRMMSVMPHTPTRRQTARHGGGRRGGQDAGCVGAG